MMNPQPYKSVKRPASPSQNQSPMKGSKSVGSYHSSKEPSPMNSAKRGATMSEDQMPFKSGKSSKGTNGTMSKFPAFKGSAPMGNKMHDTEQLKLKRKNPSAPKKKEAQVGAMVKLLGGKNSPFVGDGYTVG